MPATCRLRTAGAPSSANGDLDQRNDRDPPSLLKIRAARQHGSLRHGIRPNAVARPTACWKRQCLPRPKVAAASCCFFQALGRTSLSGSALPLRCFSGTRPCPTCAAPPAVAASAFPSAKCPAQSIAPCAGHGFVARWPSPHEPAAQMVRQGGSRSSWPSSPRGPAKERFPGAGHLVLPSPGGVPSACPQQMAGYRGPSVSRLPGPAAKGSSGD
jgi:hypothetical protein